jgi:apolipoprotein N-acyltransferase
MNQIKFFVPIYLCAILSGILLSLGWPNSGWFPFLFVGFVPFFMGVEAIIDSSWKFKWLHLFFVTFITHFIWSGMSISYLYNTSPKTYFIVIVVQSFTLALALFTLGMFNKFRSKYLIGIYVIGAFMSVEYLNQNWMIGSPYFVLGNGLGMYPSLIQFYEFVGVEGGTLLILLLNVFAWISISQIKSKRSVKSPLFLFALSLFPFVLSPFLKVVDEPSNKQLKVAALHTYMETYTEEGHKDPSLVIDSLWKMSTADDLSDSELIVWPETIISNLGWIHNISNEKAYQTIEGRLSEYPRLSICTGGYGFSVVGDDKIDAYSVKDESRNFYYTSHNVALTMSSTGRWPVRSKAIFIPFQERIPFLDQFPFLRDFADVVGSNTMISYYEHGDDIHKTSGGKKYAPILCFESVYPLLMADLGKQSDLILILSNEFWNNDLRGSDQYMTYHVGMAIQSRTPIVRSSNSGISVVMNRNGNVLAKKRGKDTGVLKTSITLKVDETFYEKISGLFYTLSLIVFPVLFLFGLFRNKWEK